MTPPFKRQLALLFLVQAPLSSEQIASSVSCTRQATSHHDQQKRTLHSKQRLQGKRCATEAFALPPRTNAQQESALCCLANASQAAGPAVSPQAGDDQSVSTASATVPPCAFFSTLSLLPFNICCMLGQLLDIHWLYQDLNVQGCAFARIPAVSCYVRQAPNIQYDSALLIFLSVRPTVAVRWSLCFTSSCSHASAHCQF